MATNQAIKERLTVFRQELNTSGLSAYIIPTVDPHGSEYLADHWKCREWLCGFTGSAGVLIVTLNAAALWVDSRYHIQADLELRETDIEVRKVALLDYVDMIAWLRVNLSGGTVGMDARLCTAGEIEEIASLLETEGLKFSVEYTPVDKVWSNRPTLPLQPPFIYPETYAGVSATRKLELLRERLNERNVDSVLITALDEIAWLLNIRGADIECNPVVMCYAYISRARSILFIDERKLTEELKHYFASIGMMLRGYESVFPFLTELPDGKKVMIDMQRTNYKLVDSIPPTCRIINGVSPIARMKAVKNEVEIAGIRKAMVKDGVALAHFWCWMERSVGKERLTEVSVADKLVEFKTQQEGYMGESFPAIVGYQSNGAIVHYRATEPDCVEIRAEGLLLIDCGSQYLDGTTDITRTYALGALSAARKRDYTLVLKGHIAIASCQFPKGTRGAQIDVLARLALWRNGMNYQHGTGHGVGHFLNVHEGPQSIRMNENTETLLPGMLISNEPGIYKKDEYGIRIENLVLVQPTQETAFGEFYGFETLTLLPYDLNAIDPLLLTPEEKGWINRYHRRVREVLSPLLSVEEQAWLQAKTKEIEM